MAHMRSPAPSRPLARLAVALVLAVTAVTFAPGNAQAADSSTSVLIGQSGGRNIDISLNCGGQWRAVGFYYGASRGGLKIKPSWRSWFTFKTWNSSDRAYITYTCSGTTTRVTFRYYDAPVSGGGGPV